MTGKVKVAQLCLTLCDRMNCRPWNSSGQNTGVGSLFPSPRDLPSPGIKTRSPTLPAGLLPAESPGKPKNTWVGSLSLLLQTQELNWGLLPCRWILYQLSYQGSPTLNITWLKWTLLLSSIISCAVSASFSLSTRLINIISIYLATRPESYVSSWAPHSSSLPCPANLLILLAKCLWKPPS